MPDSATTVRTITRDTARALSIEPGETMDVAMRRVDRLEREAVCRHLVGELASRTELSQ